MATYYQHVAYLGGLSHALEVFYPIGQTGPLQVTDITKETGTLSVAENMGLTSWVDGTYEHVVFISGTDVVEAFYPYGQSGLQWSHTDVTSQGAPGVNTGTALTSWQDPTYQHFAYIDPNGIVQGASYPIGGVGQRWQITELGGPVGPYANNSLTSWVAGSFQYIGFIVGEFISSSLLVQCYPLGKIGQGGLGSNITDSPGAYGVSANSPLTSWVDPPVFGNPGAQVYQHVVYVDLNSHLQEAFSPAGQNDPQWQFTDITKQITGAPGAPSGTPLTSWADSSLQHVVYVGNNQHVIEAYGQIGQQEWNFTDITGQIADQGAPAPGSGSLTSWVAPPSQHVLYIADNYHLIDAYYPVGAKGKQWRFTDITPQTAQGVLTAVPSSPLTSWVTYSPVVIG